MKEGKGGEEGREEGRWRKEGQKGKEGRKEER